MKRLQKNRIILASIVLFSTAVFFYSFFSGQITAKESKKQGEFNRDSKIDAMGICPPFYLRDEDDNIIDPAKNINTNKPYSPRQTCGKCHDYNKITEGFHFQQGKGEKPLKSQTDRIHWALTPGLYGGNWCSPAPLYNYLSPKNNTSPRAMDMTSYDLVQKCGSCHPGGGPLEYDRSGNRYDRHVRNGGNGLSDGGDNRFDGDYFKARWSASGVVEADCLLCHLPAYNHSKRNEQINKLNYRWAATAGAGFADIKGSVADKNNPAIAYIRGLFSAEGTIELPIIRQPRNRACLSCHAQPGYKKRGANFSARTDVHLRAGLKCVDCHPAGTSSKDKRINKKYDHNFGKGDDPSGLARNDLDDSLVTCKECHTSGKLGAPLAAHRGLPPVHLERIACQTCHIPERTVRAAQFVASDVLNPGKRIPSKGKQLWTFYGPDMKVYNHYGFLGMMGYDDKPDFSYMPIYARYRDKIFPVNRVHTAWPAIETDGKKGLMQPKMNDVYKMWEDFKKDPASYPELAKIRDDNGDTIPEVNSVEEIDALIASVRTMLEKTKYPMEGKRVVWVMNDRVYRSGANYTTIPKEDWEASPYGNVHKYSHDVFPARSALGAKGCVQCHGFGSPFFFGDVVRYPFDQNARPVTEKQYHLVGVGAFWAYAGAFREDIVKNIVYINIIVAIAIAVFLSLRYALYFSASSFEDIKPDIMKWMVTHEKHFSTGLFPVVALVISLLFIFDRDTFDYVMPTKLFLDHNHTTIGVMVLVFSFFALRFAPRKFRESSVFMAAKKIIIISTALVLVSGFFMMIKADFSIVRLSYTFFDLGLAVILGVINITFTRLYVAKNING